MQSLAQKIKSVASPARLAYSLSILALGASLTACGGGTATTEEPATDAGAADAGSDVSGEIQIDGSSTVFPISEAMAEEFQIANPDTRVTVGVSGSGGGFKKFCGARLTSQMPHVPIKDEEVALCDEAGIEFIEVPIAYDGITLVTNSENDWAQCLDC